MSRVGLLTGTIANNSIGEYRDQSNHTVFIDPGNT